jgi:hypothetical protein
MITYKFNEDKSYAQRIVDGIETGEWLNANNNQQFKKDLANGAELQDAEGNVIDGIAYLKELA